MIAWGDVPTWIAAIGALLAVGFAIFLWRSDLQERERKAVEGVTAWLEAVQETYDDRAVILVVQNATPHPIFRVQVESTRIEADPLTWEMLPPGAHRRVPAHDAMVAITDDYGSGVNMRFIDAAGKPWRRSGPTHRLTRA